MIDLFVLRNRLDVFLEAYSPHQLSELVLETLAESVGKRNLQADEVLKTAKTLVPPIQPLLSILNVIGSGASLQEAITKISEDRNGVRKAPKALEECGKSIAVYGNIELATALKEAGFSVLLIVPSFSTERARLAFHRNAAPLIKKYCVDVHDLTALEKVAKSVDMALCDTYGIDMAAYCRQGTLQICTLVYGRLPMSLYTTPLQISAYKRRVLAGEPISLGYFSHVLIDGVLMEVGHDDSLYDFCFSNWTYSFRRLKSVESTASDFSVAGCRVVDGGR